MNVNLDIPMTLTCFQMEHYMLYLLAVQIYVKLKAVELIVLIGYFFERWTDWPVN